MDEVHLGLNSPPPPKKVDYVFCRHISRKYVLSVGLLVLKYVHIFLKGYAVFFFQFKLRYTYVAKTQIISKPLIYKYFLHLSLRENLVISMYFLSILIVYRVFAYVFVQSIK